MQARPCSSASASAASTATATPAQAEPVTDAVAAAKKAAISILPSRPTSTMPPFSENSPPMAQSTRGVATRSVDASIRKTKEMASSMSGPVHEQHLQPGPRQVRERPREQDDEALDHHHHLARDGRDLEGQLGAALLQRPEQQGGQHDAQRAVAPHQGDGDAGEAVARRKIEHDA